jgi:hypothetical protein
MEGLGQVDLDENNLQLMVGPDQKEERKKIFFFL